MDFFHNSTPPFPYHTILYHLFYHAAGSGLPTTATRFVITRTSGVATASRSQCFRQLVDVDI